MESRDVTVEDVIRKERELMQLEDDYQLQKRNLENRYQDLEERCWQLNKLIDKETDIIFHMLRRYSVSANNARGYLREIDNLQYQSEQVYKENMIKLEDEREQHERIFRKRQSELEEEYSQIRRKYASTNQ